MWCMPVTLADALGYYRDEGLDVAIDSFPSGAKAAEALMGGSVDVADFIYEHNLQMAAEGQRVRTFFVITIGDSRVLAVTPSAMSRIRRVEDLKGSSVGVPSAGSGSHLWVKYYLGRHGLGPADYSVAAVGMGATAIAAAESGRVDAVALSGGDHFRMLSRHPDTRILVDASTVEGMRESFGTEFHPTGTLTAKQFWLERNGDAARHLTNALRRTLEWIAAHSPEEIREKLPESLRSQDAAVDLKIIEWGRQKYSHDGAMPEGGPEAMKRYLDATIDKVRDTKIDLAQTWTNEYLTSIR
jgi:NitT/TauT family transport system substrate-binding protein